MKNPHSGGVGPRNVIASRVRKERLALDLTQDELSGRMAKRQVFIDRVAITKVENGQRCVFDFELRAFAEALKIDVKWLLGMVESGGPKISGRHDDEG